MRFIVKIICLSIILIIADIACGADLNHARIDAEFPDKVNELASLVNQDAEVNAADGLGDRALNRKDMTVNRLRRNETLLVAPKRCVETLDKDIRLIEPGQEVAVRDFGIAAVHATTTIGRGSTRKVHEKGGFES